MHNFSSWASSAPLLQYAGSSTMSNSYSLSLTSVMYSARPISCDLGRLLQMLKWVSGLVKGQTTNNTELVKRLIDALHLDKHHYQKLPTSIEFVRFVVSAISGLVEQNIAYPTEYPMQMTKGWPLVGLCQLLDEDPTLTVYFSGEVSSNTTAPNYYDIQELMPSVVGLYYNATGQATDYCVKPLGGCSFFSSFGWNT